jgi:hypothetical protein
MDKEILKAYNLIEGDFPLLISDDVNSCFHILKESPSSFPLLGAARRLHFCLIFIP